MPRVPIVWQGAISDSLGELPATGTDVESARRDAASAIGRRLGGFPATRLRAESLSSFVQANRVQGLTIAPAVTIQVTGSWQLDARIGVGQADERAFGGARVSHASRNTDFWVHGSRVVRDVSDHAIGSGLLNSIRTVLDGSDRLDWVQVDGILAGVRHRWPALAASVEVGVERAVSKAAAFEPLTGAAPPNPLLGHPTQTIGRVAVAASRPRGLVWRVGAEGGAGRGRGAGQW